MGKDRGSFPSRKVAPEYRVARESERRNPANGFFMVVSEDDLTNGCIGKVTDGCEGLVAHRSAPRVHKQQSVPAHLNGDVAAGAASI